MYTFWYSRNINHFVISHVIHLSCNLNMAFCKIYLLLIRRSSGLSLLLIIMIFILPLLLRGRQNAHGRSRWGGKSFIMIMPLMFGGFGGGGRSHSGLVDDLVVEASLVAGSHSKDPKHKIIRPYQSRG